MQYKYQLNNWSCGLLSVHNSLLTFGLNVDLKEIKRLAQANHRDGTSKRGIIRAVHGLGAQATVYQTRNQEYAWRWLRRSIQSWPCILLLDDTEHWGTVVGSISDRVILIDSSMTRDDRMGVYSLDKREILDRWIGRGLYYAIRVSH